MIYRNLFENARMLKSWLFDGLLMITEKICWLIAENYLRLFEDTNFVVTKTAESTTSSCCVS